MLRLPPLYYRDLNDNIIVWSAFTQGNVLIVEHGRLGGKQAVKRSRCAPTNIGRVNERDGAAQALFEAQAAWDKKRKSGYQETIADAVSATVILPMLAHSIVKRLPRKTGITEVRREFPLPIHAQLKYNGLRCLAYCQAPGKVEFISRENERWGGLHHIREPLAAVMTPGQILDGEIYCHGLSLERINSLVKLQRPETAALWLQLYDMPVSWRLADAGRPWSERYQDLLYWYSTYVDTEKTGQNTAYQASSWPVAALAGDLTGRFTALLVQHGPRTSAPIRLSPTWVMESMTAISALAQYSIENMYEGLILRPLDKPYVMNKRVDSLIKWKYFEDGEFTVLDARPIEWFDQDRKSRMILDVFVVQNDITPATFEVKPRGTIDAKQEMWDHRNDYIGTRMTVRFPERSESGIPQGNPVGFFRLAEDLPADDSNNMWE